MGKAITIKDWDEIINGTWRTAVEAIIQTGEMLIKAKASLPHGQWLPLCEQLPFSKATATKLMKIARHAPRWRRANAGLPPNWSTLYYLTMLSNEQWRTAIRAGNIHKNMERADAIELLST
jgi:hypothetical protein